MKLKTVAITDILDKLESVGELIVTLPTKDVEHFRRKLAQAKTYRNMPKRNKVTCISEVGDVATLHIIYGDGMVVELYEMKEPESL